METASGGAMVESPAKRPRRRRRTREDVVERIREAARMLFAERGYHGTATREIARVADVSETLLFRYYGSKAALFEEVVCAPFDRIMQAYVAERRSAGRSFAGKDWQTEAHDIFVSVYDLFEHNQALFTALLSVRAGTSEDLAPLPMAGLLSFYTEGTRQQLEWYRDSGEEPAFDIGIGLRLAFGMLASSVLLKDWLFPDGAPPREQIVAVLEMMVSRALGPAPRR